MAALRFCLLAAFLVIFIGWGLETDAKPIDKPEEKDEKENTEVTEVTKEEDEGDDDADAANDEDPKCCFRDRRSVVVKGKDKKAKAAENGTDTNGTARDDCCHHCCHHCHHHHCHHCHHDCHHDCHHCHHDHHCHHCHHCCCGHRREPCGIRLPAATHVSTPIHHVSGTGCGTGCGLGCGTGLGNAVVANPVGHVGAAPLATGVVGNVGNDCNAPCENTATHVHNVPIKVKVAVGPVHHAGTAVHGNGCGTHGVGHGVGNVGTGCGVGLPVVGTGINGGCGTYAKSDVSSGEDPESNDAH